MRYKNNQKYNNKQKYQQRISQYQIRKLQILKMSSEELETKVNEILEVNPFLDISDYYQVNNYDFDKIASVITTKESLKEILFNQLCLVDIDFDLEVFEYLVDSLDSNGYLRLTMDEINSFENEQYDRAKRCLQSLDPAGVGAASLKECLTIQLKRKPDNVLNQIAIKIVCENLALIAQGRWEYLCTEYGVSSNQLERIIQIIRDLNPKPGAQYAVDATYAIPDVIIKKQSNQLQVSLYDRKLYHLILKTNMVLDEEYSDYVLTYTKQAQELIEAITKRTSTLFEVTGYILKVQESYFLNGDSLVPMRLNDIAQALNLSESTISRCINQKFFEFNENVYPFISLFERKIDNVSVDVVKKKITDIVKGESPYQPFSDKEMQKMLEQNSIFISRSVIAKYRKQLGILSTYQRRKIDIE